MITTDSTKLDQIKAKTEHEWASGEVSNALIQVDYHNTDSSRATETLSYWKAYLEALRDYTSKEDDIYTMGTIQDSYTFDDVTYLVTLDSETERPIIALDS